jgi:hypothetical protein
MVGGQVAVGGHETTGGQDEGGLGQESWTAKNRVHAYALVIAHINAGLKNLPILISNTLIMPLASGSSHLYVPTGETAPLLLFSLINWLPLFR